MRVKTVGGIIVVRYGDNARQVIDRVKHRLTELAPSLPAGVEVVPVYDRSELIDRATSNLSSTLIKEMLIVCADHSDLPVARSVDTHCRLRSPGGCSDVAAGDAPAWDQRQHHVAGGDRHSDRGDG